MSLNFNVIRGECQVDLPYALHVASQALAFDPAISAWLCFKDCGHIFWDALHAFKNKTWDQIRVIPVDGREEFALLHRHRGIIAAMEGDKCHIYTVAHAGWIDTETTEKNWSVPMAIKRYYDEFRCTPNRAGQSTSSSSGQLSNSMPRVLDAAGPRAAPTHNSGVPSGVDDPTVRSEEFLEDEDRLGMANPEPPLPPPVLAENNLDHLVTAVMRLTATQAHKILKESNLSAWYEITYAGSPLDRRGKFHPLIIKLLNKRMKGERIDHSYELLKWVDENPEYYAGALAACAAKTSSDSD